MSKRAVQSLRHYLRQVCAGAALQADAHLLRQFIEANDQRAFEILLDRHGPMVLGTARRLVNNAADADDVFQAVFLSLARLAKSIRQGKTVPNWLYTTTCRIAARARKRRRAILIENVPEPSAASTVESDLIWREVRTALDEELQRLPERLRSPLVLCYLSGLTRDEAAEQLGWSLGTLKRRLEEGRTALRKRLERRGISAAGLALAMLSPLALNATVRPALAKACLAAVFGKEAAAGASALLLTTTTTFKGIAMKAVIVSLALVGLAVGIYSSFGRAEPPKPVEEKKTEEPKATAKKLDSLDDPLPAGSTMRLGTSRFRHGVPIVTMAISADGKTAVAVNANHWLGCARGFDLASGRALFTFKGTGPGGPEAVAFSPDGQWLVTKGDLKLRIRDSKTGQELRTIDLPKANPWSSADVLVFTPDGKAVATISDGKVIHLIDFESGKTIRDFPHEGWGVLGIAISQDGKLMAGGGYDNEKGNYFARLWEVETGKELRRFMHGKNCYGIRQLAFSPDAKTLASVGKDDGSLRLFDVDTGKERKAFPEGGDRRIRNVAFAPDGKTVAAAGDSIRLYDATTGEERLRIDRKASCLHFTDEGKSLTGAVDGAIYRWDTATGKPLTPESAGDSIVEQILVTSDGGRIITRGQGADVHIWDGGNGKHLRAIKANRADWPRGIALSPDGRYLVWAVGDNSVKFSDPQSPDSIIEGARLRLYDVTNDQFVERFPAFKGDAHDVTFTAGGKTLITVDHRSGMLRLWNVETGKEETRFQAVPEADKNHSYYIRRTTLSPDGKTLAVACDPDALRGGGRAPHPHAIRLWDVASGKELHHLAGHVNYVLDMAFSPDGRLLVTAGDKGQDFRRIDAPQWINQAFVWDVAAGKRVAALPDGLPVDACSAAFSPDGRSLATASPDGKIRIWEIATWTVRTEFTGHRDRPTALTFTPAGQLLSGSLDTTVLAWDVRLRPGDASGTLENAWNDLTNRDARGAFKTQGRLLATPAQVVKLFVEKIKTVEAADADRLRQLIADLDSAKFEVREAASKTLSELGEKARPALEEAVRTSTSLEVAERAKKILGELEMITPEQIRQTRAVMVLESIASPEAKQLLKQWAAGLKGAVLTHEAQAAFARLERAATSGPNDRR